MGLLLLVEAGAVELLVQGFAEALEHSLATLVELGRTGPR